MPPRFVSNLPGLSPADLRPARDLRRLPSWLPHGKSHLVPMARHALYAGFGAMGLKKGDAILVPAFCCNTVTQPLEKAGARVVLFNIKRDCTIDLDQLHSLKNSGAKAILWYHYLGLSYQFGEVKAFARQNRMYLIEDCAHALFSDVGRLGDIAVYSIRKTLPVMTAGALVLNRPGFRLKGTVGWKSLAESFNPTIQGMEGYRHRLFLQSRSPNDKVENLSWWEYLHALETVNRRMTPETALDATTRTILHAADPAAHQRRRFRLYQLYLKHLAALTPLKKINPGAAPIAFLILVKNRAAFRKRLEKAGIEASTHWPDYLLPRGAVENFPDAKWLADRVLSLPVHHRMTAEDVEYVCKRVKALC